jgi:lysophospholipase L1-like esterase
VVRKGVGPSRALAACLLTTGLLAVGLGGLVGVGPAGAADSTSPFLLVLGGSASVGWQPTLSNPHGVPTDEGYANDLVSYEASRGVTVQLSQLGCPGETTTSMLYGGHCYTSSATQLDEALTFLQAHHADVGLVTIDMGFNNVRHCLLNGDVQQGCVARGLDAVNRELPTILSDLIGAAGPDVTFVGMNHYNPFFAEALSGPSGQAFALASASVMNRLNDVLHDIYSAAGIAMANVATAFEDGGVVHENAIGSHVVVSDVTYACELTWMCEPAPFGPNLHPNAAGYVTIAAAIEAQLHSPW